MSYFSIKGGNMRTNYRVLEEKDILDFRRLFMEFLTKSASVTGVSYEMIQSMSDDNFKKQYLDDKFTLFGAFLDDLLVGITIGFILKSSKMNHRAGLYHLFVTPKARKIGIAKGLLNLFQDYMKGKGIEIINLQVVSTNKYVIEFFENNGFFQCGEDYKVIKYDNKYLNLIYMAKDII